MKLPEPMKQLSDDYIRGWNECLEAVRNINNTEDKPSDDGWIPWSGGECPVGPGVLVITKWRGGEVTKPYNGSEFRWSHLGPQFSADIVAYKVVG